MAIPPWTYPDSRYYDEWFGHERKPPDPEPDDLAERDALRSDGDIKSAVVERLKTNTYTKDGDIQVDVRRRVVILDGEVSSWVAKRSAGDDSWDTLGVVDVNNQLRVRNSNGESS